MTPGSFNLTTTFSSSTQLLTKEIALGSVAGFASGYTLKQIGKILAILIGSGFIGLQVARAKGWIDSPKWDVINQQIIENLDFNGDGIADGKDVAIGCRRLIDWLGFGLPSGSAFAGCFFLGFWMG